MTMYEAWDGGGGILWATVVAVDPGKLLQVTGTTFPNWGGPSIWLGSWELAADETETILKFSESSVGRTSDARAAGSERDKSNRVVSIAQSCHSGVGVPST